MSLDDTLESSDDGSSRASSSFPSEVFTSATDFSVGTYCFFGAPPFVRFSEVVAGSADGSPSVPPVSFLFVVLFFFPFLDDFNGVVFLWVCRGGIVLA